METIVTALFSTESLIISVWALLVFLIVRFVQAASINKNRIDTQVWTGTVIERDRELKVKDIYISELKKVIEEFETQITGYKNEIEECNSTILYQANERNGMCKTCTLRNLSDSTVDRFGKITSDTHAKL